MPIGPFYLMPGNKFPAILVGGELLPMQVTESDFEDCCCGEPRPGTCVMGQYWLCNPEPLGHCDGWQRAERKEGCYDFSVWPSLDGWICDSDEFPPPTTEGWTAFCGVWWKFGDPCNNVPSDPGNCNTTCLETWGWADPGPWTNPDCDDLCPPCGTCCNIPPGGDCQTSLYEYECDDLGGTWYEDARPCEDCPT